MKPKANKKILIISSAFMLLISLPMMLFTFNMVYSASPYDKSGESLQSIGLLIQNSLIMKEEESTGMRL